jgi:hypothetical protein
VIIYKHSSVLLNEYALMDQTANCSNGQQLVPPVPQQRFALKRHIAPMPAPTAPFRKLGREYPKPPSEPTISDNCTNELKYENNLTIEPMDLVMYEMKEKNTI